jgi:hypothetical protein
MIALTAADIVALPPMYEAVAVIETVMRQVSTGGAQRPPRFAVPVDPPLHLPDPRSRKAGRVRLHRDGLKPEAQAHEQRYAGRIQTVVATVPNWRL